MAVRRRELWEVVVRRFEKERGTRRSRGGAMKEQFSEEEPREKPCHAGSGSHILRSRRRYVSVDSIDEVVSTSNFLTTNRAQQLLPFSFILRC